MMRIVCRELSARLSRSTGLPHWLLNDGHEGEAVEARITRVARVHERMG